MRSNTTFRGHTFVARSALLLGVLAPTALHAETAQHAETELRAESGKQANAATRASSVDAPQLQPSAAGVPQAEELQAQPPPAQTPPAQQQPGAEIPCMRAQLVQIVDRRRIGDHRRSGFAHHARGNRRDGSDGRVGDPPFEIEYEVLVNIR